MAGQIGFLLESLSNEPRKNNPQAGFAQNAFGSGEDFRRKLGELNAERSAEGTLAQLSPAAPFDEPLTSASLNIAGAEMPSLSESGELVMAKADLHLSSVERLAAAPLQTTELSGSDTSSELLSFQISGEEGEQFGRLDTHSIESTKIAVTARPELADTEIVSSSFDGDRQSQFPNNTADNLIHTLQASDAAEQFITSDRQTQAVSPGALSENTLSVPEHTEIRQPSLVDSDVPPAPSQLRPEHQFSRMQQVPAFTPFQQNAATALPSTPENTAQPDAVSPSPVAANLSGTQGEFLAADTAEIPTLAADTAKIPTRAADQGDKPNATPAPLTTENTTNVRDAGAAHSIPGQELQTSKAAKSDAAASPLAQPQTSTPGHSAEVIVSADTPLAQRKDAALLSEQAAVEIAAKTDADTPAPRATDVAAVRGTNAVSETVVQTASSTAVADNAAIESKSAAVLETPLTSSQQGPAQAAARVQIPAFAAQLQQAGTVVPQAQIADIPNVLSDALNLEDGSKRITVQLDPPELGRVSIDFKFDGNVLQNVLVTGETPEAMRRLRLMHFELVQSLEQHGFSGQELDFSQREDDRRAHNTLRELEDSASTIRQEDTIDLANFDHPTTRQTITSEGLNLKL